jgi:branched-chain amino acid transport system permease protein
MRAVSMDKDAASLMGININQVISFTFFIGAALAAAKRHILRKHLSPGGRVYGKLAGNKILYRRGAWRIGDIRGAMLGGFIMGVTEILATSINSNLGYAIGFIVLILILLFKPAGIRAA